MKRKILITTLFALFASAAFAGLHQPAPLVLDLDGQIASGDMLTAANSVNSDEYIGCGTRNSVDGLGNAFRWGFCQASDNDGNAVICLTVSDVLLDAMHATADHSYITFSWDDDGSGNLTCTSVGLSTQSFYIDKVKN